MMNLKSTWTHMCNFIYPVIGLIGMSIFCSCTTLSDIKSKVEKKERLKEYFYGNTNANKWTVSERRHPDESISIKWSSEIATNSTVSSKEFLEILSSDSQPIKDALSQYGYPNFIGVVKCRSSENKSSFGDIFSSPLPFDGVALLYCINTNILFVANQKTGETWSDDYTDKILKFFEKLNSNSYRDDEYRLEQLRRNFDLKFYIRDMAIWYKAIDFLYRNKLDDDARKAKEAAEREKEAAEKEDFLRQKRLPSDQEIRSMILGCWNYEKALSIRDGSISEQSIVEYCSNNVFRVKGKVQGFGQNTSIKYSGNWEVSKGRINHHITLVEDPGAMSYGIISLKYIGDEVENDYTYSIQDITAQRIEIVKNKKRNESKILTRLKTKPFEIQRLDEQGLLVLKQKADDFRKKTFVFKGFYMGMPIEDSANLIFCYLGNAYRSLSNISIEATARGKWFRDKDSGLRVEADGDGKVIAIYLPKKAVDKMFDVSGNDVKSFIKTFQSSYSLGDFLYENPALEVLSLNSMLGQDTGVQPIPLKLGRQDKWTLTSPQQGYSVTVFGSPFVFDEDKLRGHIMEGLIETIPCGSLIVRKINTASFD